MPGFDNGVVYFEKGIDPRGVTPIANQMGVDGRLLIGSSASPYVVCANLTSNSGITVANGAGTIALNSVIQSSQVTITSAQLKAINTSPVVMVPAQGANTMICPLFVSTRFVYGGSNVFTATDPVIIELSSGTGSYLEQLIPAINLNDTQDVYYATNLPNPSGVFATGTLDNTALIVTSDSNLTGNAAGDNALIVQVIYYVSTLV